MSRLPYPLKVALSFLVMTVFALLMLALAIVTLFLLRRRWSAWLLCLCGRSLLRVWGVRLQVHQDHAYLGRQTVFVVNHSSSLDVFAIIAAQLPDSRFFLSGFLRKFPQFAVIGTLTGIFWTVPQEFPQRRTRIFQRACDELARTGESVCLSPEGRIVTSGGIGAFNKGAFHLAAALRAPMQPLFVFVPKEINPWRGWRARPGTVHLHVGRPIDTSAWRPEDAATIKEEVRDLYVRWQQQLESTYAPVSTAQQGLPDAT